MKRKIEAWVVIFGDGSLELYPTKAEIPSGSGDQVVHLVEAPHPDDARVLKAITGYLRALNQEYTEESIVCWDDVLSAVERREKRLKGKL